MAIFEEVKLTWEGRDYIIPPDQIMRCIAKIEDVVTLGRLSRFIVEGDLPIVKLSQAFGVALRHAGARVTDEEVYAGIFREGQAKDRVLALVYALQAMMIPPEQMRASIALKKSPAGDAPTTVQ